VTYVLLLDLRLFLWRKVVLNVEELSDLFGCLALNHVGAAGITKGGESLHDCGMSGALSSKLGVKERTEYLHRLASDIEEGLNVEVVCCQDDLEQHLLVDLDELCIPVRNVGCASSRFFRIVGGCGGVAAVVRAVLEDLYGAKERFQCQSLAAEFKRTGTGL